MSDDPYKAPRDENSETTAMPYVVWVGALFSVGAVAGGFRTITDMQSAFAGTTWVIGGLLFLFGTFKAEVYRRFRNWAIHSRKS